MLKLFAVLWILSISISTKKPKGLLNDPPPKEQSQHFYSETEKSKQFTLNNLQVSKNLVLILHPKANVKDINFPLETFYKFQITDNHKLQHTCKMIKMNSLCVVPKLYSSKDNSLRVTCSQLPCEFTFQALQTSEPKPIKEITDESLQYLYRVDSNESLITVTNTDTNIKNFAEKVRIYSNSEFEISVKEENIMYVNFEEYVDNVFVYPTQDVQRHLKVTVQAMSNDVEFQKRYRFVVEKYKEIKVQGLPAKQLRVDMALSQINSKRLEETNITFMGYKTSSDSNPVRIQSFRIPQMQDENVLDLNIILKKNAFEGLDHFAIRIESSQSVLVSFKLRDHKIHDIGVEEESYISLDKGQTVEYNILASSQSDGKETVEVQVLDQKDKQKLEISLSSNPCYYAKGCGMKVKAKEAVTMAISVTLGRKTKGDSKYIQLEKSLKLILQQGQISYLIHNYTSAKGKKISVNTNNVMIYVGGQTCPTPSPDCNQYSGNLQRPILIQSPVYPIYITVVGLQLVAFNIRADQIDSIQNLEEGIGITQTIHSSQGVFFRFAIKEKQAVNFNMIAPVNTYKMFIANSNQKPDPQDFNLQISSNYIKYEQNEVQQLVFTILVIKTDNSSQDSFTLMASTANAIIVLSRGQPHYDVIAQAETKHYVLMIHAKEIEDDQDTHFSFSLFQNIENPKFSLSIGTNSQNMKEMVNITRRHDLLDIQQFAADMCDFSEDEICDLYIDLQSHNDVKLDVTVAILNNHSVIQLKPGVWQSYQMAQLTSTNHFYYIPTNNKHPIMLQFSHTLGAFKISYVLWTNKDQEHDPAMWPFPADQLAVAAEAAYQTSDYSIHHDQVAKCFPDCILLISLISVDVQSQQQDRSPKPAQEEVSHKQQSTPTFFSRFGEYSIMASNSMVQLRESEKISITFSKDQTKYLLIDLTPFLSDTSNLITIYSTNILGYTNIVAKLSTNRDPSHPTKQDNDYNIEGPQTQIKIQDIKARLEKYGLEEHEQVELILMLKSSQHARVMIEYTSKQGYIQPLTVNTVQVVSLPVNTSRLFSVQYYQDYKVKITRTSGFPSIAHKVCKATDFQTCLEQLDKEQGSMLNSKIDQIPIEFCEMCILVLKFTAVHDSSVFEVTAVGGVNSATELKQGSSVTDFVQRTQINRYRINVIKQQETIITVTVFEGNPDVIVRNELEQIQIAGKKKGNLIQFHIPSSAFKNSYRKQKGTGHHEQLGVGMVQVSGTALSSVFSELLVEISDNKFNCSYSISYTLGQRMLFIQDGTLTSALLRPKESILYSYHNSKSSTAFVSISFPDSSSLEKCQVQYASFSGNQSEEPVLKAPSKIQTKSRSPKPSITFQLQGKYTDFQIQLTNKDTKDIPFNITINHVDIILLPYGYKYPAYIGKDQASYFVVEAFNKGYIQFNIQKCTADPITFSYAMDDQSFQSQDYTFSSEITDSSFKSYVHVEASTIFLMVKSVSPAMFSIQANWFADKKSIPVDNLKPGDRGIVDYAITGEREALVSFSPLDCPTCHSNNVSYQYLIGKSYNDVLAHTACEGSFFLFAPIQVMKLQTTKPKPSKTQSGKMTFPVTLPGELVYLGLKAHLNDGREVFYSVVQISTMWGSLQKNKNYHLGIIACTVCVVVFLTFLYKRRPERRKLGKGAPYQDLPQEFEP